MIRQHDFNTQWWGSPVGIVADSAFFDLPESERARALAPFCWVEFKSRLRDAPSLRRIHEAGFFLADTQIEFRIGLNLKSGTPYSRDLGARFADTIPFGLGGEDMRLFEHERYRHLPGQDPARTNERYLRWARQLVREHPETCLEITAGGAVQGWFLARLAGCGLNLTLAMLHRSALISGFLLYEKAFRAYAARGHRVGWASFSATNTAVLNIYAKLGAQFIASTGIWLWSHPQ